MTPEEGSRTKLGGSLPLWIDHKYGLVPPVAASVAEYGTVSIPSGIENVVTANCGPVTVSVTLTEAVCAAEPESVTLNVRGATIAAVGVPLISPLDEIGRAHV